jgi:predicted component of type VI protein secretion system
MGGGDPIPLLKRSLLVGRRESCDIVLRFSNVSAHHCQLSVVGGYWYVRDMKSRNGVKVNGVRVTEKRLDPGDTLSIAKHNYEVKYSPIDLGAVGPPPPEVAETDIFGKSLLERAGLTHSHLPKIPSRPDRDEPVRYDPTKDDPGQLRFRTPPPKRR